MFKSEDNEVETKQWYFEIFLQTNIDKIKLFPWFFEKYQVGPISDGNTFQLVEESGDGEVLKKQIFQRKLW